MLSPLIRQLVPLFAIVFSCAAAEPSFDEKARAGMLARFSAEEQMLNAAIDKTPDAVALYSRRGDARMFLARFAEAIADYEKMIALDPSQDAPHWRLGIAYYLTGDFAKSARQFEKYQNHESGDRENGIWHFLANARAKNIAHARTAMIPFDRFDREPFPALYDMFAGKKTTAEVFAEIEKKNLSKNETVMFFANYYVGLNEQLTGDTKAAREYLQRAVQNAASREQGYMWQVSRLQFEALTAGK
jgi:lipoprotein NlpI